MSYYILSWYTERSSTVTYKSNLYMALQDVHQTCQTININFAVDETENVRNGILKVVQVSPDHNCARCSRQKLNLSHSV